MSITDYTLCVLQPLLIPMFIYFLCSHSVYFNLPYLRHHSRFEPFLEATGPTPVDLKFDADDSLESCLFVPLFPRRWPGLRSTISQMLCLWHQRAGGGEPCGGLSATLVLPGGMAEEYGDPTSYVGFDAAFTECYHHDLVVKS